MLITIFHQSLSSGWAFSQLCASKSCSTLCFRGNMTEALLAAAFCCLFSTAEDTNAFSQDNAAFLFIAAASHAPLYERMYFQINAFIQSKTKEALQLCERYYSMLPPMAAFSFWCMSAQVCNARGQHGGLLQAPESFPLDCHFVYYSFSHFSYLQHLKEQWTVQGESVPDYLTELFWKHDALRPFSM